jgi:hypothetical protein
MSDAGSISTFSASTVASLRKCGLAVYRRRSRPGGAGPGPSNPVARLGLAAHRVLAWVADEAPDLATARDLEERIRERWKREVASEEDQARRFYVEAANGPVERWPRFATIQESLIVDGAALAHELAELPSDRRWTERRLDYSEGDLYGWIDLVIVGDGTATVIEHKTGAVKDGDLGPTGRYLTQVLLYAALVRDAGLSPVGAQIRPLGSAPLDIELSSGIIATALAGARSEVASYNEAVASGETLGLARPSEDACHWCEFLVDCPAIWGSSQPDLGELRNLEGLISDVQVQQGRRLAVRLTVGGESVLVSGLRAPLLGTLAAGDEVRIVGAREVGGGRFRAGRGRTVIVRTDAPPE